MGKKAGKSRQRELEARRRRNRQRQRAEAQGEAPAQPAVAVLERAPQEPERQSRQARLRAWRQARKSRRVPRWRSRPWVWNALFFLAPFILLYCCQLITLQDMDAVSRWLGEAPGAAALTYAALLGVQLLALSATGSLFWSELLPAVPALGLCLASYLKSVVNGIPLLASDLAMAGQAGEIAGFLRPGMDIGGGTWGALGLLAALLTVTALFAHKPKARKRGWYGRSLAGLLALLVLASAGNLPALGAFLDGPGEESQVQRNDRLGLLAGLYSAWRQSAMREPGAYSEDGMHRILAQVQADTPDYVPSGEWPNIILYLSESFFDPTVLTNVTFQNDPVPNFHALAEEWPTGRFLSNTYAGGTGNVEMEIFTGIPSAFLGAGESLTTLADRQAYTRIPSLMRALRAQGYAATMVHAYHDKLYDRAWNIPRMGFDKLIYADGFPEDAERAGGYISDGALVDMLIGQLEEEREGPLFLYGLSMENHQPYFTGKFDTPSPVKFTCNVLDGDGAGTLDGLFHGLYDADASLGKLLDYLEDYEEPTIVLFLGDHLPGMYLDEEHSVYSALGYSSTSDTSEWGPEEMERMHSTDFLVWNNFGAVLEAGEKLSCTGLAARLMDWAGVDKPLYFDWVDQAMEEMLLYRERLFVSADGTAYEKPPEEYRDTVDTYRNIVYDILYGKGYIAEELLRSPEH